MEKKREAEFDIAKGILILCVVIGHGGSDAVADFMYRFHMPLFFILSGYFMQKHSNVSEYATSQFKKLMIPYFMYMAVDFIFFDHLHNLNRILHYLWGGRFINGVYWYITCFYISSVIFVTMLKYFSSRKVVLLSVAGGGIALIESQLLSAIPLLVKPGIPFDADVVLLCLSYLTMGYYGKQTIDRWRKADQFQVDFVAIVIAIILVTEFAVMGGRAIDMKQVLYPNLLYNYLIPIGYGLVLLRLCRIISKRLKRIKCALQAIGQMTIPIMYLHEPLNRYLQIAQDNILVYVLIGIGAPAFFVMLIQRHHWGKYLGVYPLQVD